MTDTAPSDDARAAAQAAHRALKAGTPTLAADAIALILDGARSHYAWKPTPVPQATLERLYAIMAAGPTSMNSCPARLVFVTSAEGKARLSAALKPKNVDKMMGAPVTVIVAHDLAFWEELTFLFPHEDRRPIFANAPAHAEETAFRNATLQGAYLMIAARALGLDVGAMSGFSNEVVDAEFFAGTTLRSNFLLNIGHADETALFPKLPRLPFERACSFA